MRNLSHFPFTFNDLHWSKVDLYKSYLKYCSTYKLFTKSTINVEIFRVLREWPGLKYTSFEGVLNFKSDYIFQDLVVNLIFCLYKQKGDKIIYLYLNVKIFYCHSTCNLPKNIRPRFWVMVIYCLELAISVCLLKTAWNLSGSNEGN